MKLVIPSAAAPATPAPAAASSKPAPSGRTYRVKDGDNLTRIARSQLGDGQRWDEIFAANRDQLAAPSALRPGQTLRLP